MKMRSNRPDWILGTLAVVLLMIALAILLANAGCSSAPRVSGPPSATTGGSEAGAHASRLLWPFALVGALGLAGGIVNAWLGGGVKLLVLAAAVAAAPALVITAMYIGMDWAGYLKWPVVIGASALGAMLLSWVGCKWWVGVQTSLRAASLRRIAEDRHMPVLERQEAEAQASALDWVGPRFRTNAPFKEKRPCSDKTTAA